MNRKWLGLIFLIAAAAVSLNLASCAHSSELVAITIQPGSVTVGASNIPVSADAGAQSQLTALGTYIHPPVTKDITSQVTWASNDTQMFSITSAGELTATGAACGDTLVSATVVTNSSEGGISSSGAQVAGYMTASVVCFSSNGGGGGTNEALTVTFGSGTGNVVSTPAGASCNSPGPCVGSFAAETPVSLNAQGTGGENFQSWVGCDTPGDQNPCSVTMTGNRTVTVTFQ